MIYKYDFKFIFKGDDNKFKYFKLKYYLNKIKFLNVSEH